MNAFGAALQERLHEKGMSLEEVAARMRALLRPEIREACEPYPTTAALRELMMLGWFERRQATALFVYLLGEALGLDEAERRALGHAYLEDVPR
jgi:transcriptional regulator with XRE-family HTH domain